MYERKTNVEQLRTNRGWRAVAKERHKMKRKIKCGDNPWKNSWHVRMNAKEPKYYCDNCGKRFFTRVGLAGKTQKYMTTFARIAAQLE